jgi:hypothetical protein
MVTESRLIAFLIQEVVGEEEKKRGRKSTQQKNEEEMIKIEKRNFLKENPSSFTNDLGSLDTVECRRGIMTVKGYVSAIVDLWEFQRNHEGNKNPHPRSKTVTSFLQRISIQRIKDKDCNFTDRGKATMQDIVINYSFLFYIFSVFLLIKRSLYQPTEL